MGLGPGRHMYPIECLDDERKLRVVGDYKYFENKNHCLGKGSFGEVYAGRHNNNGQLVALKKVFIRDNDQRKNVMLEVKLIENISHPNCIKLIAVVEEDLHIYVITDLCTTNYLQDNAGLGDADMHLAANQLANGYEALYDKNIIHRDIKPQNILVNVNGREFQLKIADFGCGRFMEETYAKSIKGTEKYLAPEVGAKHIFHSDCAYYDARVDIWALGLVLFECATNSFPWEIETLKQMFHAVANNQDINLYNVNIPSYLDTDLQDLLKEMLHIEYRSRIAPKTFFEYKFLRSKLIGGYKYDEFSKPPLWVGTFGIVYKGFNRCNNNPVCIITDASVKMYDKMYQQEVSVMKSIIHPNCLQLLDIVTIGKDDYIVTEFCTTTLKTILENNVERKLIRTNIELVAKQLACGYKALFHKKIVHGNITPLSIVVVKVGNGFCLKISDFVAPICYSYIIKHYDDDDFFSWVNQCIKKLEMTSEAFLAEGLESWSEIFNEIAQSKYYNYIQCITYTSPELLAKEIHKFDADFDGRVDIWSLGVVLFECCMGTTPLYEKQRQKFIVNIFLNLAHLMPLNREMPTEWATDGVEKFIGLKIKNSNDGGPIILFGLPILKCGLHNLLYDMINTSYSARMKPQDFFKHKLITSDLNASC